METIIERVNKVLNDFKGDKAKAYEHFVKYSDPKSMAIFALFGEDIEAEAAECRACAEYLKSIM